MVSFSTLISIKNKDRRAHAGLSFGSSSQTGILNGLHYDY